MLGSVEKIWQLRREGRRLRACLLPLALLLRLAAGFYFIGLYLKKMLAWQQKPPKMPGIPVVAVGNLSVGGSGKTVFVQFLVRNFFPATAAILSRGYGGAYRKHMQTCVVSDGQDVLATPELAGDEPYSLAGSLGCPVAVGADRFAALQALMEKTKKSITVAILDDGYQTQTIAKDFTILLIDSRFPPSRDLLFPAGTLRERDYGCADAIILTHAAGLSAKDKQKIIAENFPRFPAQAIFAGHYVSAGIFIQNDHEIGAEQLAGARVVVCAGIAVPQNFLVTLQLQNIVPETSMFFADHHAYVRSDIDNLFACAAQQAASFFVTTEKDWVKIRPLLNQAERTRWCVVRVRFEFLSCHEYDDFKVLLEKKVGPRD